ncbi:unnamed protein product [Linum trigynum]|uniref:40S ribosomal protein S4 n=1 Tax=Linum trigynum TaxID=586398 RepID=A0AAV2F939_9ROSI
MTATGSPADSAPAGEAKPPDLTAGTRRPSEETSSPDGKKEREAQHPKKRRALDLSDEAINMEEVIVEDCTEEELNAVKASSSAAQSTIPIVIDEPKTQAEPAKTSDEGTKETPIPVTQSVWGNEKKKTFSEIVQDTACFDCSWSQESESKPPTLILRHRQQPSSCLTSNMARGLKKHLKRLNAPKHWMLDKLGGAFAPKPSSGPHKSRECLPLVLILRNRLKYALTYREVIAILMQRHVMVDHKVRTDKKFPAGFMDVVSIPKTNENFRLLYDTKGRFRLHSIRDEESKFKLCKVRTIQFGQKGIPYLNTFDGRTIRYPDPLIKPNDTIKLDLESSKIADFIKFDVGNVVMVTGGRNRGRVGVIKNREKHKGSFETVHIQDSMGHEFATRLGNVFTIGKGTKPWVSLPKGKGIKLSIIEEARKRTAAAQSAA